MLCLYACLGVAAGYLLEEVFGLVEEIFARYWK